MVIIPRVAVMQDEAKPVAKRPGRIDRQLLIAVLISAAVLIPRGVIIIRAQSPCFDDHYHLIRGILFWKRDFARLQGAELNDPLLGAALSALPAWIAGQSNHVSDAIRCAIAVWKSILFLPCVAVIFHWTRSVYSSRSAWLVLAMVLIEPTLAAHLPLPTVDVLGMEGVVIGSWALWRYVVNPTKGRWITAIIAVALALLTKNTALLLCAVAIIFAVMHWLLRLKLWRQRDVLRGNVRGLSLGIVLVPLTMWVVMMFECSVPPGLNPGEPLFVRGPLRNLPIPNGLYLRSVVRGVVHANHGHTSYLLGKIALGWWYYFPVVATYKIPLGFAVAALLAVASLFWRRPRYQEAPLLVCGGLWTASLMTEHVDIGFRHFLPAEIFWIMLISRCVADGHVFSMFAAWTGMAAAAIHVALWTPDYLSYINFPRRAPYLQISDSNVDWGQGLKQLRKWIDARPDDHRPIYVAYFGSEAGDLYDILGPRLTEYDLVNRWIVPDPARPVDPAKPMVSDLLPDHGLLVISPVCLTGQYDQRDRFAAFRPILPMETIGHCLLVYDLDELHAAGKLR